MDHSVFSRLEYDEICFLYKRFPETILRFVLAFIDQNPYHIIHNLSIS